MTPRPRFAFAGVAALGFACSSNTATSPSVPAGVDAAPVARVPVGGSPVRGPADAWVTMIEFADFECPYCGEEEAVVEGLLNAYPNDLRLVFKNFPLTGVHPHAEAAAIAAACAGEQGDFWTMHDLLFVHQLALDTASLAAYAQQSGVDVSLWNGCLSSQPPAAAVQADVSLAAGAGVDATPTFVINGQVVVGAVPSDRLQAVVEAQRAAARNSGVSRAEYYATVVLGGP